MNKWTCVEGPKLLRAWREKAQLTQQDVADRIGCGVTQYSAFETGRARPGLDYAVAIERVSDGAVAPHHWTADEDAEASIAEPAA